MHSTLAMSAVMWRAEHPALENLILLEGIRQKGQAMREIRAALDYGGPAPNDTETNFLMSTISTLAIVEVNCIHTVIYAEPLTIYRSTTVILRPLRCIYNVSIIFSAQVANTTASKTISFFAS